jgi:hypothetical protein
MSDGQQTPKKQYELQVPVEVGAHLSHVPSNTNAHGAKFTAGTVQGSIQGDEEVTFDISEQGSSVSAPRVIGDAANGWVNGNDITLSCLGQGGQAHSTDTLNIKVVLGLATSEMDATVGVIHEAASVNILGKLKVTEGINGVASAHSILTPFIGKNALVKACQGLLRCDQIDGMATGHRIEAGTISRGAQATAIEELIVDQLEGYAEAKRVVIKAIIGTRFVNEAGIEQIRDLDPEAPHDVYHDVFGEALAEAFNLKGIMDDITIGRLLDIFLERKVWSDAEKLSYGDTARKTHGIFVKMVVREGWTAYPEKFFDTSFEVRDLATGKLTALFTIEGDEIENARLRLTAALSGINE